MKEHNNKEIIGWGSMSGHCFHILENGGYDVQEGTFYVSFKPFITDFFQQYSKVGSSWKLSNKNQVYMKYLDLIFQGLAQAT